MPEMAICIPTMFSIRAKDVTCNSFEETVAARTNPEAECFLVSASLSQHYGAITSLSALLGYIEAAVAGMKKVRWVLLHELAGNPTAYR